VRCRPNLSLNVKRQRQLEEKKKKQRVGVAGGAASGAPLLKKGTGPYATSV